MGIEMQLEYGDKQNAFLMLNCSLLTSLAGESERASERFDEYVTTYLSSLRRAVSDPEQLDNLRPFLSDYDIEVIERLGVAFDAGLRYTIHRAPEDLFLVSTGVFDSAGRECLPIGPDYRHGSQGQMGKGDTFYHFTFSFSGEVENLDAFLRQITEKISLGFRKYAAILTHVRGKHFDFDHRMRGSEVFHLARSVEGSIKKRRIEVKRNEFLDAYMEWKTRRTQKARRKLSAVASQLRELDPSFNYNPVY
jgi:hypothetical protein